MRPRLAYSLAAAATAAAAIATSPAHADGVYLTGALGPGWLRSADGSHSDINRETTRTRTSIGVRAGDWAIEPWLATESTGNGFLAPSLTSYGLDLKRVIPVSRRLSLFVRGSMSHLAYPDQAPCCVLDPPDVQGWMYGYGGRGLGAGVGGQLAFHVLGMRAAAFVEDSYDYYRLLPPSTTTLPAIDATVTRISFGVALGSDF